MKRHITIIGGGTAGYMSAAYFRASGHDVTIIYNNEDNPRLVVGESLTANTFYFLEDICGFKRSEWIIGSDAIHKNGVLYRDWGKKGESYINGWRKVEHKESDYIRDKDKTYQEILNTELYVDQVNDTNRTLFTRDNIIEPAGFETVATSKRFVQNASRTPYGIQLDAVRLTEFIKSKIGDDLTTIHELVSDVIYEGTKVAKVVLANGDELDVDFIVDASGFAKVIAKTSPLFEEEDISDISFTNRALFNILEYTDRDEEMKPRTSAICGAHGWAWHTPTAKRVGTGYVFNSDYCTDEVALQDYCDTLKIELTQDIVDGANYINFPNQRTKDVLMDNILCIGMSAGFIEPMEAPSLLGVQLSLEFLDINSEYHGSYNNKMADYVKSMCKFIGIRYKTSKHTDTPFWDHVHDPGKCKYINDIIDRFDRDGYVSDIGYDSGVCMPPRCFDDLIKSSKTPNVKQDDLKHPEYITMVEYLDILAKPS